MARFLAKIFGWERNTKMKPKVITKKLLSPVLARIGTVEKKEWLLQMPPYTTALPFLPLPFDSLLLGSRPHTPRSHVDWNVRLLKSAWRRWLPACSGTLNKRIHSAECVPVVMSSSTFPDRVIAHKLIQSNLWGGAQSSAKKVKVWLKKLRWIWISSVSFLTWSQIALEIGTDFASDHQSVEMHSQWIHVPLRQTFVSSSVHAPQPSCAQMSHWFWPIAQLKPIIIHFSVVVFLFFFLHCVIRNYARLNLVVFVMKDEFLKTHWYGTLTIPQYFI